MTLSVLRSRCAWLILCVGLAARPVAAQQEYEPLRQRLFQGWQKARPEEKNQWVPVTFSAANSLPAVMGRAIEGTGKLYAKERAQFQVKDGSRKYELWENAAQQAFSLDAEPWKVWDSRASKDHPGLVAFLSPREALETLLGGAFEKIVKVETEVLGGVLCDNYLMELGEATARSMGIRLGLAQELVAGKLKKRTLHQARFTLETRTGRMRQVFVTLRVEVDRDTKPSKEGKDWAWESYDDANSEMQVARPDDKGNPAPGGKHAKTMIREYRLSIALDVPKPLEKEPEIPQEAKSLVHW